MLLPACGGKRGDYCRDKNLRRSREGKTANPTYNPAFRQNINGKEGGEKKETTFPTNAAKPLVQCEDEVLMRYAVSDRTSIPSSVAK